jgi:hypothetical protein
MVISACPSERIIQRQKHGRTMATQVDADLP